MISAASWLSGATCEIFVVLLHDCGFLFSPDPHPEVGLDFGRLFPCVAFPVPDTTSLPSPTCVFPRPITPHCSPCRSQSRYVSLHTTFTTAVTTPVDTWKTILNTCTFSSLLYWVRCGTGCRNYTNILPLLSVNTVVNLFTHNIACSVLLYLLIYWKNTYVFPLGKTQTVAVIIM